MDDKIEDKIKKAFENTKYEWRTVKGISIESNVSQELVLDYISIHGDELVKSSARNSDGEPLYTSRTNYRNKTSIGSRLSSVLRNRGA